MKRMCQMIGLLLVVWVGVQAGGETRLRYAADEVAARRVQAVLDDTLWTQVVRIRNRKPTKGMPPETWATVFELGDRLWIYLPREGTSSLSVYAGRLDRDKADLASVLLKLMGGYATHDVIVSDDQADATLTLLEDSSWWGEDLPNACFVSSVAWFQRLIDHRTAISDAHLLMFYGGAGVARWGHTVLLFQTLNGWFVWDPSEPEEARSVRAETCRNDLELARKVGRGTFGNRIEKARRFDLVARG